MKYPKDGRFGDFGGKYIPETLVPAVQELEENYLKFKNDKNFKKELDIDKDYDLAKLSKDVAQDLLKAINKERKISKTQ